MTTVLLERLKDKNYDVKKWLLEDVVRLFCICISLRDESRELTEQEILQHLQKEDDQRERRYQEKLNPKYPVMLSEEKLKERYQKEKEANIELLQESLEDEKKVAKIISEFNEICAKNKNNQDELVFGVLNEARKQLAILKDDVKSNIVWYQKQVNNIKTFEQYCKQEKSKIDCEIRWLNKEKEEAMAKTQKVYKNAGSYKRLIDAINK